MKNSRDFSKNTTKMIVREAINFERGLDPKDVFKLGGKAIKIYGADFEDKRQHRTGTFVDFTDEGTDND
jgi:hypothetical protein